jgi:hypothetical protein
MTVAEHTISFDEAVAASAQCRPFSTLVHFGYGTSLDRRWIGPNRRLPSSLPSGLHMVTKKQGDI